MCGLKSQTLSFPLIVYGIILVPGCKSRVIQHFLHLNLFILPCFYETLLLNVKTTDCAALSPFSCRETIFQPVSSQSISGVPERQKANIPQNMRELCSPSYPLALFQGASSHIKAHVLGLFCSGRCERSARGVGSAVASWLHSVVTHNGAPSRPQRASTSRALPLFKNVFVLLFFLGTM